MTASANHKEDSKEENIKIRIVGTACTLLIPVDNEPKSPEDLNELCDAIFEEKKTFKGKEFFIKFDDDPDKIYLLAEIDPDKARNNEKCFQIATHFRFEHINKTPGQAPKGRMKISKDGSEPRKKLKERINIEPPALSPEIKNARFFPPLDNEDQKIAILKKLASKEGLPENIKTEIDIHIKLRLNLEEVNNILKEFSKNKKTHISRFQKTAPNYKAVYTEIEDRLAYIKRQISKWNDAIEIKDELSAELHKHQIVLNALLQKQGINLKDLIENSKTDKKSNRSSSTRR